MKNLVLGIGYNFKGFKLGISNARLLLLGLVRFAVMVIVTFGAAVLILTRYEEILSLMWQRPESVIVVWLWHLTSWVLALVLTAVAALLGYLLSQILFNAIIMDKMSQITERLATGQVESPDMSMFSYFIYLVRQEIPRAVLPLAVSLVILILGWFTPLGPILTIVSPLAAGIFLAWDNTDLVPARRLVPFDRRWRLFRRNLLFHLGFGLPLLIPGLNIVMLSFAPVGATLYYLKHIDRAPKMADSADSSPIKS